MADQPSKKRRNDTELNKDNWQEESEAGEDGLEAGTGEFERAPPEELAKRRKIVVQRGPNGQALQKGANPFAGVTVQALAAKAAEDAAAPSTSALPADADGRPESTPSDPAQPEAGGEEAAVPSSATADAAEDGAPAEAQEVAAPAAATGFGSLSVPGGTFQFGGSFGASNGAVGDGGMSRVFGTGFGGFAGGFSGGSIFSAAPSKADTAEGSAGTVPLFAAQRHDGQADDASKSGLLPNERPVTGEEDEVVLFSSDASLFVFGADKVWKERGKGEVRVNKLPDGHARIVMRQKGNYRLMLNANLFPEMSVQVMEGGRGVTFNCVNAVLAEDVQPLSVPATVGSETVPASIAPAAEPTEPAEAPKAAEPRSDGDKEGTAVASAKADSTAAASTGAGDGSGAGDGGAGQAAPAMAGMVLHALRLRPAEKQEAFLRVMNACKDGTVPVAGHADAWVPPF